LFNNSTAHKALRKELVDKQRLQAVISMPSGVFQPYSGVSTAILIFTKTNAGGTDKVWFYEMNADGFSLDKKRTALTENDIPDIISRFHNLAAEETRTRTEQSFLVPVEEIREKGYDLSINKYKEVSPGKVFMIADLLIISSILFLPGKSLQDLVYGYVVTFAFSYTVDYILTGSKQSVQMLIITNKYEEIANKLCYEMNKGVTAINSIGWYKKSDSMIIMVVTRKDKMYEVMSAVKEVDNRAFLTVSTVMGVYGEGFDEVKAKSKAVKAKS
jgi:type I restriction-modification system DNA methylase subunit